MALNFNELSTTAPVPTKEEVNKKADKPATFTTDNLAKFDAQGNPVDSGRSRDGNGNLDATEFTFTPEQVADYDAATVGTVINKATTPVVLHGGQHYVVRKSFAKTNGGWDVDSVTGKVVLPGASGVGSAALGDATQAIGSGAVSTGKNTKANGAGALSSGQETDANGTGAHAEGQATSANATCAHSEGYFTMAQNQSEHAQGEYNASHTGATAAEKTLNSIGIGDSTERKNAVEVMRDGKVFVLGLGGYDGKSLTNAKDVATVIDGKVELDIYGKVPEERLPMDIDTSTLQGTTGPAPSSGYGTSGGIRVKTSIMGLTDGGSLVKGDRITYLDLKTGPNGVTEITNLYAYICDDNNAQYNNVVVGKSKVFNWPGSLDTAVQVEFEGGVSIDPDVTYNILFSQTSKNIGDVVETSECKTLRVPLVPIAQSPDYCCFNGSFSPLQGHQIEMTMTYKRTMVANVPVSEAYGDAMESQWKFSPSYVQGYTITMNLMQTQDGVKATPYAGGGAASMSPITLQGDEETLTWNPMGSGISPEWYGSETLTATRIDKKQFVVGSQKDKKFQPAGVYLEANILKGLTFDVTSNTDVQKALGAIITALGGEATNVPTT